MKNLFLVNRLLVIINIILGFTIYFGLLFLILLGAVQIIMSIIIASSNKTYNTKIKTLFNTYALITTSILVGICLMSLEIIPISAGIFYFGMGSSIIMAFLHLNITHLIYQEEIKGENLNLQNKVPN